MMMGRQGLAGLAVAGLCVMFGRPALADAIDGSWCFADGRSFEIAGPNIRTPGGNRIQGDYDRHGFAYLVPAGETGAGNKVLMSLIDDDTLHVAMARNGRPGPVQTWRRCQGVTS